MTGELFSRVHISLTSMLHIQKTGEDIKHALTVLQILISDGRSLVAEDEYIAIRSACVVALRILADGSLRDGSYKANKTLYSEIISLLFQPPENTGNSIKTPSLDWQKHIRPLLAILVSDINGSNQEVHAVFSAIQSFVNFILQSNETKNGLFSKSSLTVLAKLATVCLENAENSHRNPETRLISMSILNDLTSCIESVDSFSILLPGISFHLINIVTKSSTENARVVVRSLEVLSALVLLCLNDDNEVVAGSSSAEDSVPNTIDKTTTNLKKMITSAASNLVVHRDSEVRYQMFHMVTAIYTKCSKVFEDKLNAVLYDTVLLLIADSSPKVRDHVSNFLPTLRSNSSFSSHLYDKVVDISDRMPLAARQSTEPNAMICQLNSALSIGPSSSDYRSWCTSRGPIVAALRALSLSIRFDVKRVRINSASSSIDTVEAYFSSSDLLRAIPLQFSLGFQEICLLSRNFAQKIGIKAIELIYNELSHSDKPDLSSFLFLAALIISNLHPSDCSNDILYLMGEECVTYLENLPHEPPLLDSELNDESLSVSQDTLLGVCSLACLTAVFTCLIKNRKETEQHLLLMKNLYSILGLCARNDWILRDSAISAISIIAKSQNLTIGEFLCENAAYVISSVSLSCLSSTSHVHSPAVLSSLIDLVDDRAIFDQLMHSIQSMLNALDSYDQEFCLIILRVLRSFVRGMLRWFPEEKPQANPAECLDAEYEESVEQYDVNDEEEMQRIMESEKKTLPPITIISVEQILLRTKHLIASSHVPVQIVVLEIMKYGLRFVRNFDDTLLPMIHQNWVSLIRRLNEDSLYIRSAAFEVICEMAALSHTFVQRRIRLELWPKITAFMTKEAKNTHIYQHSAAFKYQETVLKGMFDIWSSIDMAEDEWSDAQSLLGLYRSSNIHPILQGHANTAYSQLQVYWQQNCK